MKYLEDLKTGRPDGFIDNDKYTDVKLNKFNDGTMRSVVMCNPDCQPKINEDGTVTIQLFQIVEALKASANKDIMSILGNSAGTRTRKNRPFALTLPYEFFTEDSWATQCAAISKSFASHKNASISHIEIDVTDDQAIKLIMTDEQREAISDESNLPLTLEDYTSGEKGGLRWENSAGEHVGWRRRVFSKSFIADQKIVIPNDKTVEELVEALSE